MNSTDLTMAALRFILLLASGLAALEAQSPSFLMPQYIPIGAGCCAILTGDFNRDGKMDIAVSHGAASFTVLLRNGDGTCTRKDISQALEVDERLASVAHCISHGITN